MKTYFFCIVLVVFFSCTKEIDKEKISINLNDTKDLKYSEIFQSFEYIYLQIPDSVPLINPVKLTINEFGIFVQDRDQDNLLIFSSSGKFERIIKSSGPGPGEFLNLEDFQILLDEILILDNNLKKLIKFDLLGRFKEESKIEFHPYNIHQSSNRLLMYFANRPEYKNFSIVGKNKNELSGMKKVKEEFIGINYSSTAGFLKDDLRKKIFLKLDTSYEVVIFDETGNIENEIEFDFGRYNFSDQKRKEFGLSPERYTYLRENNMVENIFSFLPLKSNFLATIVQIGLKAKYVILNEDLKSYTVASKFINDIDNFEGDFSPISQFNGNIILFKDSRSFQKEYLKSFGGKSISSNDFNKPDGIHQFYKKNEHDFQNDNFVVIKAKVR
ncbi:MAG: 6-bladed beta-propeller [Algoriphagus aquaeductus]|uniref:6-bladed beta-propeller n=1 Tax=Algoriphagus aquaeductus TaxID=475299 RepID=UPI00387A351F